jgi:broad specificity phosphatase PhoE
VTTIYLLCHGAETEALAEALRGRGIGAIHCSDLPCCRQAATVIARRLRVSIAAHPELREISPGERLADCLERTLPIWHSISRAGHVAIAIVGQADLNRMLLGNVLALPAEEMFDIEQDDGCINVVERNGSRPWVRLVNGTPAELAPANA